MKYFPYENYSLFTQLSPDEIRKRITANLLEKKNDGFFSSRFGAALPYRGTITGNKFQISRVIAYRNSFLPIITGSIDEQFGITEVRIKMRMHMIICIFMGIWCFGVAAGALASVSLLLSGLTPEAGLFELARLIPFGMLLFAYLISLAGFKYESVKSRKFLAELLEAQPVEG